MSLVSLGTSQVWIEIEFMCSSLGLLVCGEKKEVVSDWSLVMEEFSVVFVCIEGLRMKEFPRENFHGIFVGYFCL